MNNVRSKSHDRQWYDQRERALMITAALTLIVLSVGLYHVITWLLDAAHQIKAALP